MKKMVIYPGTFDPVTYGHIDIVRRALKISDRVVVAVARNIEKSPVFTLEERLGMLKRVFRNTRGVEVEAFEGLVIRYAKKKGAKVIVRGLRMISDFEYEFQMALTNRRLSKDIETIFMMPSESYSYISSKLIKEAAVLGADISAFVPRFVEAALKKKLKERKLR